MTVWNCDFADAFVRKIIYYFVCFIGYINHYDNCFTAWICSCSLASLTYMVFMCLILLPLTIIVLYVLYQTTALKRYLLWIVHGCRKMLMVFYVNPKQIQAYSLAHIYTPLISCIHTSAAVCSVALCNLGPQEQLQAKAACVHKFTWLVVQPHHLNMICDFSGADHLAVVHMTSKVFTCLSCNALSCIVCCSPALTGG